MKLEPVPEEWTLRTLRAEVLRARTKFPTNSSLMTALTERVGELAKALLELRFAQRGPRTSPARWDELQDDVQKEAIQVAAVAIRILEEGCGEFPEFKGAQVASGRLPAL